jgi:hypothetical protein
VKTKRKSSVFTQRKGRVVKRWMPISSYSIQQGRVSPCQQGVEETIKRDKFVLNKRQSGLTTEGRNIFEDKVNVLQIQLYFNERNRY